jgi:anti-sigma28 factor (negative regulator of flagellin synthesis)
MISKVAAGNTAYMQQVNKNSKKESVPVHESKEMDKVESIKEQIKNGEYKFDSQKTAQAVAQDLI